MLWSWPEESEWIRDFKKLKKWDKVGIIVGLLGLFIGLIFSANYMLNINIGRNQIDIQNSSIINSPMILESSNISVVYNTDDTFGLDNDQYPRINTLKFYKDFTNHYVGGEANFFFAKVIVPDRKEAFLEEILFNKEYTISRCNMELTEKFKTDPNKCFSYVN